MSSAQTITMLSVDWDFFIWNGRRDGLVVHPSTSRERTVRSPEIISPQLEEKSSLRKQHKRWLFQRRLYASLGLDIESELAIRPERGCVPPAEFASLLKERFPSDFPVWYCDSHVFGLAAVAKASRQVGGPVRVVHFDAHADLGYRTRLKRVVVHRETRRKQAECGSWLYHALELGLASEALLVYPDWLGLAEWELIGAAPHIRALGDRVKVTTWSDWVAETTSAEEAAILLASRSSVFSPPWLDGSFLHLVELLGGEQTCLDCAQRPAIGPHDACTPRDWQGPAPSSRALPNIHLSFSALGSEGQG